MNDPVVELNGVSHIYPPVRTALCEIDLSVRPGERVALIGPSGAGKSTLLRILNGLVIPTAGRVRTLGADPAALSEFERMRVRRRIGMIFQEFALVERLSVRTNVLIGRLGYNHSVASLFRLFPPEDVARADSAIEKVGLAGNEERSVRQLSGGQKQRVGIARALAQDAELILGDEPTANLDIRTADEILQLLVRLTDQTAQAGSGATLILSLHDVRAARTFCTRIVALRDGQIAWDGPAGKFSDQDLQHVFY